MTASTIRNMLRKHRPHLFLMELCSGMKDLKKFHCQIVTNGLSDDAIILSSLLSFAAISAAGDRSYALAIFHQIHSPNIFMCNTMIRSFSWSSTPDQALSFYVHLLRSRLWPNIYTFPFLIKASSRLSDPYNGETIHGSVIKHGYGSDVYVANTLMHMYENFGFSVAVYQLFYEIPLRDVVSWNVFIDSLARSNTPNEALAVFGAMRGSGVEPNSVTMLGLLSSCSRLGDLGLGRLIHLYIIQNDLWISNNLGNGLIDMYAKCGDLDAAGHLFDRMSVKTLISWTSMIDGYARIGDVKTARLIFDRMPDRDTISWNVMLNGYIRIRDMNSAQQLFNGMPERDVVSWNSMIVGYSQSGKFMEALRLFRQMLISRVKPDQITLISMFSICGFVGSLDLSKAIHSYLEKQNTQQEVVDVALMDMYCKCGSTLTALKIFHGMAEKTVLAWTAMITGLAMNGQAKDALEFFEQMQTEGIKPNEITFIGVLCACSHSGLVEEGRQFFDLMVRVYNIEPRTEHYGCMVDILGRAGLLNEAENFIQNMPINPNSGVWGALLGACKIHNDVQMGEMVARIVTELEPHHSGRYVLLSNIYAAEKRWDDVERVRKLMKDRGVRKTPGCSLIELHGEIHQF